MTTKRMDTRKVVSFETGAFLVFLVPMRRMGVQFNALLLNDCYKKKQENFHATLQTIDSKES